MSVTVKSSLIYLLTDFTTSGGVVNSQSLKQKLTDADLSVVVTGVSVDNATCTVTLLGAVTEEDVDAVDDIVAAHDGAAFQPGYQWVEVEEESSSDDTSDTVKATLSTGALQAGRYEVRWYVEASCTSAVEGTGAEVSFIAVKNAGTAEEYGRTLNSLPQYVAFSGSYGLDVKDGDSLVLSLLFKRWGSVSNPVLVRRARVFLLPVS